MAIDGQGVRRADAARETPFDVAFLDRVTFRDRALARELLSLFDRQTNSLIEEIALASEPRTRREAAHKLKGSARGLGAFALARAAEEVETAVEEPYALASALARLHARVAEARLALPKLLETL
jgi:HPt (histidine-containing phosphotransfer) domain-containing protein